MRCEACPRIEIRADKGRFPVYAKARIKAEAGDTVLTEDFGTGWPDTPHRVIRSSLDATKTFQGDVVGEQYLRSANGHDSILPPRDSRHVKTVRDSMLDERVYIFGHNSISPSVMKDITSNEIGPLTMDARTLSPRPRSVILVSLYLS